MRLLGSMAVLLWWGCGKEDVPAAPKLPPWHEAPIVTVRGAVEQTGYSIDVPKGLGHEESATGGAAYKDTERNLSVSISTFHVRLPLETHLSIIVGNTRPGELSTIKEQSETGWLVAGEVTGELKAAGVVYAGDGGLQCSARARKPEPGVASPDLLAKLAATCRSLKLTTELAADPNPVVIQDCELEGAHLTTLLERARKETDTTRTGAKSYQQTYSFQGDCRTQKWSPEIRACVLKATRLDEVKTRCGLDVY